MQQPRILEHALGQVGGPEVTVGPAVGEHRAFAVRGNEHDDGPRGDILIGCEPGVDAELLEYGPMVGSVRRTCPAREAHRRVQRCEPCGLVGPRATGRQLDS